MTRRNIVLWCVFVLLLVCFTYSSELRGEDGSVVEEELLLDDLLFGDLLDDAEQPAATAVDDSTDAGLMDIDDFLMFEDDPADEPAPAANDDFDFDALFADEPAADASAPLAEAVPAAAPEPAVETAADDDFDFDDFFADEPAVAPEPVAVAEVAPDDDFDLDDFFADEPAAVETAPVVEAPPADDFDFDALADEPDVVPEAVAEAAPVDDDFDLDDFFADEPAAVETAPVAEPMVDEVDELDLLMQEAIAEAVEDGVPEAPPVDDFDELLGFFDDEPAVEPVAPVAVQPPPPAPVAPAPDPLDTLVARPVDEPRVVEPPPRVVEAPPRVIPPVVERRPEPPADPRAVLFGETEALRRQALQRHAEDTLERAAIYLAEGLYQDSVRLYEQSLTGFIQAGDIPGNEQRRLQARLGLAESYYRWGLLLLRQNDLEAAEQAARNAAMNFHQRAGELLGQIEELRKTPPPPPPVRIPPRWEEKELIEKEDLLAERLRMGRQFFHTGELEQAKALFEYVLRMDPYNVEAMRMLHRVSQRKLDLASKEFESTRTTMMAELRRAWNPRDYAISETAEELLRGFGRGTVRDQTVEVSERMRVLQKMEGIIIPEIDFRQANIQDVIAFLQDASVEFDTRAREGEPRGVNIILNLAAGAPRTAQPTRATTADPFADAFAQPDAGPGADVPLITFTARQISLYEALKIVTQVARLKHRIEGTVVMIVPEDAPMGAVIHRMYDVLPTVIERIREIGAGQPQQQRGGGGFIAMDAGPGAGQIGELKEFFGEMGVSWPAGTSIRYLPAIGKLVVANTSENLTVFEQILNVLNVVPNQIEIEARFVEVNQTDLDSLGFEWRLTDNWQVLQRKGQEHLPPAARQRIEVGANHLTKGNRFLHGGIGVSGAGVEDNILSVASVLTNPELQMVLHMLERQGNTDLLSAPKVTTQSGAEATIKVVTEYIYPTDFNVTPITGTDSFGNSVVVGGVVEPSGFQTREVGVILQVLPEVSAEGLINLTMSPEVVSEPIWRNYGSVYTAPDGSQQQLTMEQPFFHTRTVSTSISIYNNATVVMGGMINEIRTAVDDKVPFFGDIPLVGRLFRSKFEHSEKRNLLIFVTARLVDPAGRPLQPQRQDELLVTTME